jgi:hypothetical protein
VIAAYNYADPLKGITMPGGGFSRGQAQPPYQIVSAPVQYFFVTAF